MFVITGSSKRGARPKRAAFDHQRLTINLVHGGVADHHVRILPFFFADTATIYFSDAVARFRQARRASSFPLHSVNDFSYATSPRVAALA